jgi:restriction system protein
LRTRTQWRREGRRIRKGASPSAFFDSYYYGRTYELYSLAETEPVTPRTARPASVLSFAEDSLGSAIQTINDAAKRRRDGASTAYERRQHNRAQLFSSQKAEFYDLKDSVLQRLLDQGRAKIVGYHSKTDRFDAPKPRRRDWRSERDSGIDSLEDEFDDVWDDEPYLGGPGEQSFVGPQQQSTVLEVIEFASHHFHRPIDKSPTEILIDQHLGDRLSPARPLGSIRLRDAEATLRAYLQQPRIVLPCQVVTLQRTVTDGQVIAAIAVPWLAICRELTDNPGFLYQFVQHPRNFEEFIAACYSQAGFEEVILTPRSGDLGRDVIAVKRGHLSLRFLDQCKAYSANHVVPANDVRAMLGVVTGDQNTSKGIITTTATFAPGIETDPILSPYIPHRLELRDGGRLREWLLTLVGGELVNL